MRMNITILGKQSDMSISDQQRTKRCLKVLKEIGFDVQVRFTKQSPELSYIMPAQSHYLSPIKEILQLPK